MTFHAEAKRYEVCRRVGTAALLVLKERRVMKAVRLLTGTELYLQKTKESDFRFS